MSHDSRLRANKLVMDLCFRIERMCRYSPLDNQEVSGSSTKDRNIVAGLYFFYKEQGEDQESAARKARANAVRLILCEALS